MNASIDVGQQDGMWRWEVASDAAKYDGWCVSLPLALETATSIVLHLAEKEKAK